MKNRNLVILSVGFFSGVLFALFDTATNNTDVAPVGSGFDFLLNDLSENLDILKIFIYGGIGLAISFLYILVQKSISKYL